MSEAEDNAVENAVLGQSGGVFEIHDRNTLAAVSLNLARQTRRTLDIASRHLDPELYDNEVFVDAVKALALGNRQARVRLLIMDSRPLIASGHRLLELAHRLVGIIEIRAPAMQHRQFNESLLVADSTGYVQRPYADRHEGTASFAARRNAMNLTERFEHLWSHGLPDPNLRTLHL